MTAGELIAMLRTVAPDVPVVVVTDWGKLRFGVRSGFGVANRTDTAVARFELTIDANPGDDFISRTGPLSSNR